MQHEQQHDQVEKTYPTAAGDDGFFFESADEESEGISTKLYPNDSKVKKIMLQRCRKEAVVRELLGKDTSEINKFTNSKDEGIYMFALMHVSTTIDGKKQPIEFFQQLKFKDFTAITLMVQSLNF